MHRNGNVAYLILKQIIEQNSNWTSKERGTQHYVLKSKKVDAATFQTLFGITEFLQVCSSYNVFWSKK